MKTSNDIRWLLALVSCVAALFGAGCGSDTKGKELTRGAASALEGQLQSVQNRLDDGSAGACRDIVSGSAPNTDAVNRILDGLPADVDSDLRNATRDSFDRLFELVTEHCASSPTQQDTNTQTTTTETQTTPTETQTETTPTEPQTTTTETLPLEIPGKKPKKPQSDGGGGGGQAAPSD